jgi:hypothetical protein
MNRVVQIKERNMKHFAAATLLTLAFASQAAAFSMDVSLPNLTFPETETSVSTQSCTPTPTQICK